MTHDWQTINEVHGPLVWKVVYRILQSHSESLDCYQDVLLEAFEHSQATTIRNWPAFLRWIAVRRGIDRLRRRQKSRLGSNQDIESLARFDRPVSSSLELNELMDRLKAELATLPASQAEAFWLRFIEQMSYSEIAGQMNIDKGAVGVLIHRARAHVCRGIADLHQPSTGES